MNLVLIVLILLLLLGGGGGYYYGGPVIGSGIGGLLLIVLVVLRIPLKANAFPEGSRTGFRDDSEHRSERSDAGLSIVQEVFGFVKMPGIRSVAED
jgi:hypothetical protein